MTLHAYQVGRNSSSSSSPSLYSSQTLYESSIAFGIRKALQAEQGKTDMENYIAKLEEEKVVHGPSSLPRARWRRRCQT